MALSTIDTTPQTTPAVTDSPAKAAPSKSDRRRAGRQEVNPVLVPLLRRPDAANAPPMAEAAPILTDIDHISSELAPARGIALGLMISLGLWGAIGAAVFAGLR